MSRRKRKFFVRGTNTLTIYGAAMYAIREKELDVYYATVDAQFTMEDVAQWLFPEDVIRKLKDAYPLADTMYHNDFTLNAFPLPSGDKVSLSLDLDSIEMQCPKDGIVNMMRQPLHKEKEIMGTMQAIFDVHKQFNKVRKVVDWLGENAVTPGAAVYYWTPILSLLSPDHEVHQVSGERYCTVNGIGTMLPLLRETTAILAGAALCPKVRRNRTHFTVTCASSHQQSFTVL